MKVCDICSKPSVDTVIFQKDDSRIDLCAIHRDDVMEYMTTKKPIGRPKNTAKAA